MGSFTWIIVILIIFGIINKISKKVKEASEEDAQRRKTEGLQTKPNISVARESRIDEKEMAPGQQALYEAARAREQKRENSISKQKPDFRESDEHSSYDRKQLTPYEREQLTPYEREQLTPYEKDSQTPYKRKRSTPYKAKSQNTAPSFSRLTKQQWAEGIVLAEVLNEPRAKRPHQTAGRYSRH